MLRTMPPVQHNAAANAAPRAWSMEAGSVSFSTVVQSTSRHVGSMIAISVSDTVPSAPSAVRNTRRAARCLFNA